MVNYRDMTIMTTLSNYGFAGVLNNAIEISGYLKHLMRMTDMELAHALAQSRLVADKALESRLCPN